MTLANKVSQFNADADLVHQILHGSDTLTVLTEGGLVRSLAKLIKDNQDNINAQAVLAAALAGPDGTLRMGHIQSFPSAVPRTAQEKHRESISIKDFGITSNGDQYQKYQKACDEVAADGGGIIKVPYDVSSVIDGILNVGDNVVLEYEGSFVGGINPPAMLNRNGRLTLPSGARIELGNASGLRNLALIKNGTSFTSSSAQIATWLGDAVILKDQTADHVVEDCGIFGFAQAIRSAVGSVNVSRMRLRRLQIDCHAGVELNYAYDIPYLDQIHCWPFCSVAAPGEPLGLHLLRPGTAFKFGEVDDWLKAQNCFNYGYYRGFHIAGGDNVTLISCGSDYVPDVASDGSIGYLIDGDATEGNLIGCQAAARTHAIYVNTTSANSDVTIMGGGSWECDANHVFLERGRATIHGYKMRGGGATVNGIYVAATFDKATILGNTFKDVGTGISQGSSATKVYERFNTYTNVTTPKNNPYKPTVASADPLILDGESDGYRVTGTTNFGTVESPAKYSGRTLVLKFEDALIVNDGGANLKLNGSFNATAGATLTLYSDGEAFYEQGRCTN